MMRSSPDPRSRRLGSGRHRLTIAVVVVLLLAACNLLVTQEPPFEGPPHFGRNNRASLTPATGVFGPATEDNADLAYQIAIEQSGSGDVVMLKAVVLRPSTLTSIPYVLVVAVNPTPTSRCFVEITNVGFLDAGGSTLIGAQSTFVYGSIGQLDWNLFTHTCLGPGESGYFMFVFPNSTAYGAIDRIRVTAVTGQQEVYQPAAAIIPQSGTWEDPSLSFWDRMDFELRNEGAGPGVISSIGNLLVLLDENGTPVGLDFLDVPAFADTLNPGQTGSLYTRTLLFDGTAWEADVLVNFADEFQ